MADEAHRRSGPAGPGRTLAVWGGAAALAVVIGGVAIGTANAMLYSPEAEVERYLEALADGDGGRALGMAHGAGPAGGGEAAGGAATTLLDGEALAAGAAALGEVTVTAGERSGDAVPVSVEFRVDGQEHATSFTVEHTGREWLFFDRWRMTPVPLSTVRVAPDLWPAEAAGEHLTATVNGVEVTLTGQDTPAQHFAVLPPLVVEASAGSTYLQAEASRTVVDGAVRDRPVPVALDLRFTDAAAAEAGRQLDEYLSGCTGQQVLNPAGCPMGYETLNRIPPETIEWSIAPDPSVEIAPLPDDAGSAAGTDLTRAAPVETGARLTLEEIDLVTGERRRVEHEEPIVLEADLEVGPESLRYRPRVP